MATLALSLAATRGSAAACQSTCTAQLAECKRTCPEGGQARRDCREACADRSTCTAPGARIRTLAYVVSECRQDARGVTGSSVLWIRRGNCDPVRVVEFGNTEPLPDPLMALGGTCRVYGLSRQGAWSVGGWPLQRLGVRRDGSGMAFELTDDFDLVSFGLSPEQKGIFFVGSDGHGLRRLGPASRDRSSRLSVDFSLPTRLRGGLAVALPFSPDGRNIVFTDLGPGPTGEDAVQIWTQDVATGRRTQVTHLPAAEHFPFTTWQPVFVNDETIQFYSVANSDGLNPAGTIRVYTVKTNGTGLRVSAEPVTATGSHIIDEFGLTGGRGFVRTLELPGTPVNQGPAIREVFLLDKKNLLQLTNFRRSDTLGLSQSVDGRRTFFYSAADPLKQNPTENCQLFSIDRVGGHLHQLTNFSDGPHSVAGCFGLSPPGCSFTFSQFVQDPVTGSVVFDTTCDPFGTNLSTNPSGNELFTMQPHGTRADDAGLRQLTHTRGFVSEPDGSIDVEYPGPWAYSGLE